MCYRLRSQVNVINTGSLSCNWANVISTHLQSILKNALRRVEISNTLVSL